jgi:hypothetical protein
MKGFLGYKWQKMVYIQKYPRLSNLLIFKKFIRWNYTYAGLFKKFFKLELSKGGKNLQKQISDMYVYLEFSSM